LEQCVDELAIDIGMDPAEFRRMNCVKTGDTILTGMKMHPIGLSECIDQVTDAIEWGRKDPPSTPNRRRGKGIACMWKAPAMPPNAGSSAWVKMNEDGTVSLGIGGQELGQGTFTVMAQMAAAALGVPYDWVRVSKPIDTQYSPYEWQTVASRLTWSMGNAVAAAARHAKAQILEVVAESWDEDPADLDIIDGNVISYRSEQSQSLKNIGVYGLAKPNDSGWIGGPIIGRGSFMPTYVTGLEQGMSTALFESLILEEGVLKNPSFVDYRIATSADAPQEIATRIVEVPQDDGPWGARGVGEHVMVPTIAAIANAVYDAIGVRVGAPPFLPEKVYMAMLEAGVVE